MARYRIAYEDENGNGRYRDVEADRLQDALWALACELKGNGILVDTMSLPAPDNTYTEPRHVSLYPDWGMR